MKKTLLALGLLLFTPFFAPGWGFFAHRTIGQIAVYALPGAMQSFYFHHLPTLTKLITAPDERRKDDPTEAPKHFIDIDHYGDRPFKLVPQEWDKAVAKYTADTLRKYGTVPWTILETKDQLTEAFRKRDPEAILRLSADLAHYASDAYVPLHTTVNYDGQLTGQTGLHSLWESTLPERHIKDYKLTSRKGEYLKDPQAIVWAVVQQSFGYVESTLKLETETSKSFKTETKYTFYHKFGNTRRAYSDAFADAYHEKVGQLIEYRLAEAPTLVASLWMTAWKDAGSPDLEALLPQRPDKEEKKQLAAQLKAWGKNELVSQELLLAQQKEKAPAATPGEELTTPDQEAAFQVKGQAADSTAAAPAPEKLKVKIKNKAGREKQKERTQE